MHSPPPYCSTVHALTTTTRAQVWIWSPHYWSIVHAPTTTNLEDGFEPFQLGHTIWRFGFGGQIWAREHNLQRREHGFSPEEGTRPEKMVWPLSPISSSMIPFVFSLAYFLCYTNLHHLLIICSCQFLHQSIIFNIAIFCTFSRLGSFLSEMALSNGAKLESLQYNKFI